MSLTRNYFLPSQKSGMWAPIPALTLTSLVPQVRSPSLAPRLPAPSSIGCGHSVRLNGGNTTKAMQCKDFSGKTQKVATMFGRWRDATAPRVRLCDGGDRPPSAKRQPHRSAWAWRWLRLMQGAQAEAILSQKSFEPLGAKVFVRTGLPKGHALNFWAFPGAARGRRRPALLITAAPGN
jgi:hypothetical protein